MNLRYTPQAILDLEQIRDYISHSLQNPDAAKNTILVTEDLTSLLYR